MFTKPATGRPENARLKGKIMARREITRSVLVLDDEPLILKFISSSLLSQGYSSVHHATSADAARALMRKHEFSALITDIHLPDCDGRDFAQEFLDVNPDASVLMMSGFASDDLLLPDNLQDRVHLLEKPFSAFRLLQLLSRSDRPENVEHPEFEEPELISLPQTHLAVAGF
jgi:DNA-binding NtrC family response regulator